MTPALQSSDGVLGGKREVRTLPGLGHSVIRVVREGMAGVAKHLAGPLTPTFRDVEHRLPRLDRHRLLLQQQTLIELVDIRWMLRPISLSPLAMAQMTGDIP